MSVCGIASAWSCSSRIRYRYVAYVIVLTVVYIEMTSRFGVALAMIGGMVKDDCSDKSDLGSFCWSEDTKALVLGAYFYGYIAQFPITFIAKRIGFSRVYRSWMLVSSVVQVSYPFIATQSPTLLIISQAARGCMTGIMVSYNMEFTRKWTIGNESKGFISFIGATNYIGNGSGALLAGLITTHYGWQYYFYISGVLFLVAFVLHIVLVQDSPTDSWFMSTEENMLYKKDIEVVTKNNEVKVSAVAAGKESAAEGKEDKQSFSLSLRNILCRAYLWAFGVYAVGYNFIYYNTFNTIPFYLNKVLNAGPELISSITLALAFLVAFCTILFSRVLQWADRYLPWIQCRMLFTIVPMLLQVVFSIVLPFINSITGVVTVLACSTIALSTLFSGSIITINYELDPINSSVLVSIFNSIGQISGFLGPLLMAKITYTDPDTEDYDNVYNTRWSYFFFSTSGFAALASVAVVLAYVFRPNEWVDRSKGDKDFTINASVIENPGTKQLQSVGEI